MLAQQNTTAIALDKNFDRIAQKIDELNAQEIEIALNKGALYWQRRRSMSRDGFKIWLNQNGFTGAIAAKYINLAKTFVNFSPQCIDRGENPSSNAARERNPKGSLAATARCTENRTN